MTGRYCEPSDVDDIAQYQGHGYWLGLELEEKYQICNESTNDIEVYHQQPRVNQVPFAIGDLDLLEVCRNQALFIARTFQQRRLQEKVNSATGKTYDVGSFMLERGEQRQWNPIALQLLKVWMDLSGLFKSSEFVRG